MNTATAGRFWLAAAGLAVLSVAVMAQADTLKTWQSGETTVTLKDSTLTVSGKGAMADHGKENRPWYGIHDKITGLVIDDGVTHIGQWAFAVCLRLTSVTLPNSVTSIGDEAFGGCRNLKSITIPNSVASIGGSAFYECDSLTSIRVAANNAHYSSGNGVLFNKNKTVLIQYPQGKQGAYTIPNGVASIGKAAFFQCYGLTSVIIPNSVTSIGGEVFFDCYSLTSITIPNGVTSIESATFMDCSGLKSVAIPNSVTSIGNAAFYYCSGLTSVTIPNSVASIGKDAFYYCSGLKSVTIGGGVTSIGERAFMDCGSLTSIIVRNPAPPKVGGGAFMYTLPSTKPLKAGDIVPMDLLNACLYVPKDGIAAYRAADTWKEFKCIKDIASAPKESQK